MDTLHAPIEEGHFSSTLCHLGNISHRLGTPESFGEKPTVFGSKAADDAMTDSRTAFLSAAETFVLQVAAIPTDSLDGPGLGEWDLRALVGHTSRSLVTVVGAPRKS